jgi:protoheme IX farnesyltransferase
MTDQTRAINVQFSRLALSTAILTYLLIVLGGIVRVTGSSGTCPDWPTCLGVWTPPVEQSALIEYLHRVATFLVIPLVFGSAFLAWKGRRKIHAIIWPIFMASGLFLSQIVVGAIFVSGNAIISSTWLSTLHLILSLLILAALLTAVVTTFHPFSAERHDPAKIKFTFHSPFGRLTLLTLGTVFLLLISGTLVRGMDASKVCASWPLCDTGLLPTSIEEWVNLAHRLLVALSGVLVGLSFIQAWRTQRTQTPILVATTTVGVLFFAQALLGSKLTAGFPAYMLGLHQATAIGVWAALIVQTLAVGLAQRSKADELMEIQSIAGRRGLAKDLLSLTKPIVVALLLVTTYAGMVIGAQSWPSLKVTLWTLLGGFMAAGGSGAINQFIDREDDRKMQRTQKRPIPSGRLTPGEGLAFGVGIALASFYLMVAFVNFLAALLTLAGIIYYVLLYSIFLKKTTVQNIVIGGGAGAIPPLVGWAAATGGLNVPSLFLFAIVFMWTPPHFWALALVRRKDYARAGVPMLPVIRGEKETRWQILIYTVELVGLTLFLPLFGLGGAIYLVGAAALGGWLLMAAWRVWKEGGNKRAWKMYRYSSMYLAFLFVVLMIDRLL